MCVVESPKQRQYLSRHQPQSIGNMAILFVILERTNCFVSLGILTGYTIQLNLEPRFFSMQSTMLNFIHSSMRKLCC